MYPLSRTNILPYNSSRRSPFLSARAPLSGYPWFHEGQEPGYVNMFGKKRKRKSKKSSNKKGRKHVGWCLNKKDNIVKVYKVKVKSGNKYKKGRYFSNGTKVPKRTKCSKSKTKLKKRLRRKQRRASRRSKTYYYVYLSDGTRSRRTRGMRRKGTKAGPVRRAISQLGYAERKASGRVRLSCNKYTSEGTCWGQCRWTGTRCVNKFGRARFGVNNGFTNGRSGSNWSRTLHSKLIDVYRSYYDILDNLIFTMTGATLSKAKKLQTKIKYIISNMEVNVNEATYKTNLAKLNGITAELSSLTPNHNVGFGVNNGFGRASRINPANRFNYQMTHWANNAATPTSGRMNALSGRAAYNYPMNSRNSRGVNPHFYRQRNNLSGYGF